jgi:hypothetical protein
VEQPKLNLKFVHRNELYNLVSFYSFLKRSVSEECGYEFNYSTAIARPSAHQNLIVSHLESFTRRTEPQRPSKFQLLERLQMQARRAPLDSIGMRDEILSFAAPMKLFHCPMEAAETETLL